MVLGIVGLHVGRCSRRISVDIRIVCVLVPNLRVRVYGYSHIVDTEYKPTESKTSTQRFVQNVFIELDIEYELIVI